MALIDDVKLACDRLAPFGWRDLILAVTDQKLDIVQKDAAALKAALLAPLAKVNTQQRGFEDFGSEARGVTPYVPSRSLLYHAFASPGVTRDHEGQKLGSFPTVTEIEAVENLVFGIESRSLAEIFKAAGTKSLAVVVFATEYRPARDCAAGPHADLTFSRTGITRVGTARAKYDAEKRGYWPEDEDNPHAFRVVPARFTAWLAKSMKGSKARVMQSDVAVADDARLDFWIPVHKLFDGPECIKAHDLTLESSGHFFNMKLQRVMTSLKAGDVRTSFPYVIERGLAELEQRSEHGRLAVVPVLHSRLVEPAIIDGKPLTFRVPKNGGDATFTTYTTPNGGEGPSGEEIRPFPAYVHARTMVENGDFIDLNDLPGDPRILPGQPGHQPNVSSAVAAGDYDALLYLDWTGEGWVSVEVAQIAKEKGIAKARPAYVMVAAPDFFPSTGQRELSRWAVSSAVPKSLGGPDMIWNIKPTSLSQIRHPANLQLPGHPFDPDEKTVTAVVGMGDAGPPPATTPALDVLRASSLPDDGAGVFGPGWDAAVDRHPDGTLHLATYGLGSPFPEDAKLCAALSTFWPAVAPDIARGMSPHLTSGRSGTVAPLTDEEIGQIGDLPWDGVKGPRIVQVAGEKFVEMASFLHIDYVRLALENRFSDRLLSRITVDEYARRVLVAARVHFALAGGGNLRRQRSRTTFLSFRSINFGDPELQAAQKETGEVFRSPVYRIETCLREGDPAVDPSAPSPEDHRFRRMKLLGHRIYFASPNDNFALRRQAEGGEWVKERSE